MSINEIINCPAQFVSASPYMVVQHIDWIQCRYLLVQVEGAVVTTTTEEDKYVILYYLPYPKCVWTIISASQTNYPCSTSPSHDAIEQDPKYTARAMNRKPIGIPKCA